MMSEEMQMKKTVCSMIMILAILVMNGNVFAQGETGKIGFVDLQRVIDSSEQGKTAQDEIKKKSEQFAGSKEVQDTIAFLKQNAVKAVDTDRAKISEIKNDPNLKKNFDDASKKTTETIKKASDATIQKCKEASDATVKYVNSKLDEPGNEDLKKKLSDAGEKLSEGTAAAMKSIDDFMAKPEVQERLDKAKDTTIDLAEKGTQALKDWLRPDNKDEDK